MIPNSHGEAARDQDHAGKARASDALRSLRKAQGYMPLGGHLQELRNRLIRSLAWVAGFSVLAGIFFAPVWEFVMGPLAPVIADSAGRNMAVKIVTNKLTDFLVLQFTVVVFTGLIFSVPVILFELWGFVAPAVDRAYRRATSGILVVAILLFVSGVLFSRYYIWPHTVYFLVYDWVPPAIAPDLPADLARPEVLLTINDYLGFFFSFHIAFGASFEMPVICSLLATLGILGPRLYFRYWRQALVGLAFLAAVVTPPDVLSMLAMMLPLYVLYVISGGLVFLVHRRRTRRADAV